MVVYLEAAVFSHFINLNMLLDGQITDFFWMITLSDLSLWPKGLGCI